MIDNTFSVPEFFQTDGTKSSIEEGAPYTLAIMLPEPVDAHGLKGIEPSLANVTNMLEVNSSSHLDIRGLLSHVCEGGLTELINILGKFAGIDGSNIPPLLEAIPR